MSQWQPIETAPKEGDFLVWMSSPDLGISVWPMSRHPNISTIGHHFAFDASGHPTHWMPLPEPPTEAA